MNIITVTQTDFQQQVIQRSQQQPVLVYFWASWCSPCHVLTPTLEKLAQEFNGRFLLAKVNTDQNQALSMQYGVRGIPNVKLFKQGQVVDEIVGVGPEAMVRQFMQRHVPASAPRPTPSAPQQDAPQNADALSPADRLIRTSQMNLFNDQIRIVKTQQIEALEREKQKKIDLERQQALMAKNNKARIELAELFYHNMDSYLQEAFKKMASELKDVYSDAEYSRGIYINNGIIYIVRFDIRRFREDCELVYEFFSTFFGRQKKRVPFSISYIECNRWSYRIHKYKDNGLVKIDPEYDIDPSTWRAQLEKKLVQLFQSSPYAFSSRNEAVEEAVDGIVKNDRKLRGTIENARFAYERELKEDPHSSHKMYYRDPYDIVVLKKY